jgi:imidazolonepropionase-like amidohydrolase
MKHVALTNGRVVDGTEGPALVPATILIEGSVLAAVGPTADISLPEDCRVIDIQGKTVLPGLIDGHMHVTRMPGLLDATANLQSQLRASEILRECLQWGTTTVGHAGGCEENLVLRDMIDKGMLKGRARLVVSGVVTATGGHVRGEGADGPWEIRKMVRQMALAGMDFYKTCATGGFQWAHEGLGDPDYSLEELQALVTEAHMRSRLVHVHAHAQPGIQNGIEAGCDVILHGANIDSFALEGIAARGLIYMPTLYITSGHIWGSGRLPEHMTARMKAACKPHRAGVAQARELGITIATGTDGSPRPGALMHELCELVGCGFTPQEAIVAATRNTADALGIGERLGTLERGKLADCIVIDGDPLADISVLTSRESIVMVVKEGRVEVDHLVAPNV